MDRHTFTRVLVFFFVCSVQLRESAAAAVSTGNCSRTFFISSRRLKQINGTCKGASGPMVGFAANTFLQTGVDEKVVSAAASENELDSNIGTSIPIAAVIVPAAIIAAALAGVFAFYPDFRMPLLRVLVAESVPFYIFYMGFLDALTGLWIFLYTWSLPKDSYSYEVAGGLPGELNFCITNDIWSAIFSVSSEFKGKCVVMHNNHAGIINLGCIVFILCGVAYQAYVVMVQANSQIYHGSYVRAMLNAGKGKAYKVLALFMALFLVVAFLDGFYKHGFLTLDNHFHRQLMKDFFYYKINDAIIVVVNALFLASEVETHIKYDDDEFGEIKFKRSRVQAICLSSSDFMDKLQSSILQAHAGHPEKLKAMLEKDEDFEKVLRICTVEKADA